MFTDQNFCPISLVSKQPGDKVYDVEERRKRERNIEKVIKFMMKSQMEGIRGEQNLKGLV